jgi:replicative superfamily II helicase
LDVAIRKKYVSQIDVLVLDEAHIIDSDGRGSNAEVLIKRIA